ncbi:hypothetical protein D3C86_1334620 [compost metagenome]
MRDRMSVGRQDLKHGVAIGLGDRQCGVPNDIIDFFALKQVQNICWVFDLVIFFALLWRIPVHIDRLAQ